MLTQMLGALRLDAENCIIVQRPPLTAEQIENAKRNPGWPKLQF